MIYRNRKFKILIPILIVFISVAIIAVTSEDTMAEQKEVRIQTPPIVSAIPFLWMEQQSNLGEDISFDITISPDHQRAISLISKGQIDMMVTGTNVGAKLYNKEIDVRLMNNNVWGIDYLLTYGFKANSWEELKGKTLALPLKGGPLDFIARYLLEKNGINPEQVNIVYRPLTQGANYFQAGQLDAIILPEPLVTVTLAKTKEAHLSLDIQKEWGKLKDGDQRIPFVGLFVSGEFAENNPELTEEINSKYQEGVNWVNEHPQEAAEMAAEAFPTPIPAGIILKSLERIDFNIYPDGEDRVKDYFLKIIKRMPDLLGGDLPDETFFR